MHIIVSALAISQLYNDIGLGFCKRSVYISNVEI